jgi:hypothetical protein
LEFFRVLIEVWRGGGRGEREYRGKSEEEVEF